MLRSNVTVRYNGHKVMSESEVASSRGAESMPRIIFPQHDDAGTPRSRSLNRENVPWQILGCSTMTLPCHFIISESSTPLHHS